MCWEFAESNLAGAKDSETFYKIEVPAGVTTLTVQLSGGTGDADLYVQKGALPTQQSYLCRPYLSNNNETCTFNAPAAGTWYIMLRGYTAYSGVTLKATNSVADNTPTLTNNVAATNLSGAQRPAVLEDHGPVRQGAHLRDVGWHG